MKALFSIILAAITTTGAFAQSGIIKIATVKTIKTNEQVTSLKIYNDVAVVLIKDTDGRIQITKQESLICSLPFLFETDKAVFIKTTLN